jgi:hypothetical protein
MKTIMYTFAAFTTMVALSPLTTPAQADDKADRASLVGSWVQNGGSAAWIIDSRADGLHVTQIEGSGPVADFQCNTEGQSCDIKIGGHKASVSMYYNGPALVQLETKGDQIVKRRFSILPSGNSMKVEVTPMTGRVQTEQLEFERGQPAVHVK